MPKNARNHITCGLWLIAPLIVPGPGPGAGAAVGRDAVQRVDVAVGRGVGVHLAPVPVRTDHVGLEQERVGPMIN